MPIKIVAFLACQWFKPESMRTIRRMYDEHGKTPEGRAKLNARLLFYRSLTGRRLKAAFGEELCGRIIWEETTTEIGDHSSFNPPPDPKHIRHVLDYFKPDVVLCFGKVAAEAVTPQLGILTPVIVAPHPAARHATVVNELRAAAAKLRELEGKRSPSSPPLEK